MLKLLTAVTLLAGATSAQAVVLFSQDFDALAVGVPAASVPGFTIAPGTVDVVQSGTYSIDCVGNTGKCLDLAGTPGPGTITSTPIAFLADRYIKISFDVSGNQRNEQTDTFSFAAILDGVTDSFGNAISGPDLFTMSGFATAITGDIYNESIVGTRDFITYSGFFNSATAGTLQLRFTGTAGGNKNIGPIIDNILVTQSVPEPASWAMLIAGFGLTGAAMRRRRPIRSVVA